MASSAPTPRELYESQHKGRLAPYAVSEADAGGRRHPEDDHPYRTCFQRDRDRIVHCSAFRRLDFKTQVFVPHEHDHYRTRMTHTLEVAQIARTLGRALRLNEDLIEAAALAHDLGHPPFGHAGEESLAELMAGSGGFEHNRQSLRVVDYLEHPYPQFRGLNLTQAVRRGIALHKTRYDAPAGGEFDPAEMPPLEGQVVELADEIAFTSADLEDALAAEWITPAQLVGLDLWGWAWDAAERDAPEAGPVHKQIRACKAALAAMADDLIATTAANIASADLAGPDDVRRAPRRLAALSPAVAEAVRQMQDFLLNSVYLAPAARRNDLQAREAVGSLFGAYVADPSRLPERYRRRIDADGLHRVVCDYIAGMTDRFCLQQRALVSGSGGAEAY
ncbi:MAG TPA: deoxyguanosinetriphosphate triphosphohydrolase [Phycisphaerae bacterium]|nr:deoxyguanosinetriphosphate triphosphohydrolase [Phycisphaerae bacterium]